MIDSNARIVCLIASATEIVCALGLRNSLVGISHECDFPADVKSLPVCTTPKFSADGTSYEIDQRVRAVLQESLSVYRVDAKLLDSLAPTHIITQSHCEVCAVSLRDVEAAACQLIHSHPQIVSLHPDTLDDVWRDIATVADALSVRHTGEALVSSLKSAMAAIGDRCKNLPAVSLAFVEWIDPLMAGGNWMPTLIKMCNATDSLGMAGSHSAQNKWSQLVAADPDVILVAPCGFDIERTAQEMPALTSRPGWADLKAVRNGRVFISDGNQFFNRPGPRLVESLEIIAQIAHPDEFNFVDAEVVRRFSIW